MSQKIHAKSMQNPLMFCSRDDELALIESSAPEPAEPAELAPVKPEDKADVALRGKPLLFNVWLINVKLYNVIIERYIKI